MKQFTPTSFHSVLKKFASATAIGFLLMSSAAGAQARIIFQDDTFSDDFSEGFRFNADDAGDEDVTLQLGNDGTDATIIWDDGLSDLIIGNGVDIDMSGSTQFRIREEAFGGVFSGGGAPACSSDGELAVDTTPATENLYICTENATNTWTLVSPAAGDFLSAIASDVYGDAAGAQTLTIGDGTNADALTAAANSLIDFSASNQFVMRTEAADPGVCIEGELYYNTADNELRVCTAANTWSNSGPQDFEDVYAVDADNTLTTSDGFFGIATGTAEFDVTNTGLIDLNSATFDLDTTGAITVDSSGAGISFDAAGASNFSTSSGAITLSGGDGVNIDGTGQEIDITSTGGAVDVNAGSLDVDTTGAATIDAVGASNFTTDSGALSLTTTTSGNVDINAADDATVTAGDDIIFQDAQTTLGGGVIQLTDTDQDFDPTFSSDGIIDNINSFTSTANGEGASNVGIEDAGGNFTATDVEGALTELFNSTDLENDVITLEPEYPNVVVFQDGSNNRGRLDADFEVDGADREQFYQWTTQRNASHDIDLRVRYELPTDFDATGNFTFRLKTATTTLGDNSVAVIIRNDTDDQECHDDGQVVAASAGDWETITITAGEIGAGCSGGDELTAGDIVEVQIKLAADDTSSGEAYVGTLEHSYTN
ncbi:MAG: hypothetical protein P1V18_05150 [Candidatus Gracilibacteria bacterium]|nr:hypothetical protein [Candidatus Gracilibacteria bacterium]